MLTVTGGLIISGPDRTAKLHVDDFFANTVAAAKRYGIAHELLDTAEIRRRYPQFRVRDGEIGYFEAGAGFLRPERCIAVQLRLAKELGAEIRTGERVLRFEPGAEGVVIHTEKQTVRAKNLIISAGPWLPELIGDRYAAPFRILRQVLFWFEVRDVGPYLPQNCPVYIWELQGPKQAIYGFPAIDGQSGGIKVASQQYEAINDAGDHRPGSVARRNDRHVPRQCRSISRRSYREMREGSDLSLHANAGFGIRHLSASGIGSRDYCITVFRARLQTFRGHWRGAGRTCH